MKTPSLLIAAGLLLVALPSLVPTANAQHEGETLTINDGVRTLCEPFAPDEDSLGVAQSCATATITGTIQTCWNDGTYNCNVTFTGSADAGPLTCGTHSSKAAGYVQKCFGRDDQDPLNPTPRTVSRTVTMRDVPRDGITAVTGFEETLQVTFMGIGTITPTTNQTTWFPTYVFPADLTPSGSGCNGGSASVQGASVSVTVVSDALGIAKTVTVNGPRTDTDPTGANAKATASTPGTC